MDHSVSLLFTLFSLLPCFHAVHVLFNHPVVLSYDEKLINKVKESIPITNQADSTIDANVKMRTGPNYGPICAAILGVGGLYFFWNKKEADKGRFLLFDIIQEY